VKTDERVRRALETEARERERRIRRALRVKRETEPRAGVQRSKRATGRLLAEISVARAAQVRANLDQTAAAAGYASLDALLAATTDLTHSELGELLQCSEAKARDWRRRRGVASTAKSRGVAARRAQQQAAVAAAPRGAQPSDAEGRQLCLACGRWWIRLGQHVGRAHGLAVEDYRAIYRIKSAVPPLTPATRRRYDALAASAGYTDLDDLLASRCSRAETATVLGGVSEGFVGWLRREHRRQPPPRRTGGRKASRTALADTGTATGRVNASVGHQRRRGPSPHGHA
jgi:hypothetical protein